MSCLNVTTVTLSNLPMKLYTVFQKLHDSSNPDCMSQGCKSGKSKQHVTWSLHDLFSHVLRLCCGVNMLQNSQLFHNAVSHWCTKKHRFRWYTWWDRKPDDRPSSTLLPKLTVKVMLTVLGRPETNLFHMTICAIQAMLSTT